jgi:hypothetical protein
MVVDKKQWAKIWDKKCGTNCSWTKKCEQNILEAIMET